MLYSVKDSSIDKNFWRRVKQDGLEKKEAKKSNNPHKRKPVGKTPLHYGTAR